MEKAALNDDLLILNYLKGNKSLKIKFSKFDPLIGADQGKICCLTVWKVSTS